MIRAQTLPDHPGVAGSPHTLTTMPVCASCSADLAENAKFCPECGAPQKPPSTDRVVRKTVTVLFSDLVGSTTLGERHDPEQVRALMERYFAAMQTVIERHGGTVEKFIGDAIMAVFGVPVLHEDDALRAVRAAADMRSRLDELNGELALEGGPTIEIRTGVNSGEVVAGTGDGGHTLVTGDAVNTAARLEQAAAPGEVLLGDLTWQLIRHAAEAEPVPPIEAKGKADPVVAHRLVRVAPGTEVRARPSPARLVGRDAELAALREAWARAVRDASPQLATVIGAAGVGKSRVVAEALAGLEGATILRGTCLPYGEGITYWPLAGVLRGAAGIVELDDVDTARTKLESVFDGALDAPVLATRLAEAIGLAVGGAPQAELFWAVRRALESLSRRQPLAVVWDDLQWAEPTFIELVEHQLGQLHEGPILFLIMARPELLEARPDWGTRPGATRLVLEPLGDDATVDLISSLPGGDAVPADLRRRIAASAEGNPLFVHEMLAMLVDDGALVLGDTGWEAIGAVGDTRVPPTISALLAARIDRLAGGERGVAERGSVVGRSFERGAVVELSPTAERPEILSRLAALVRKELVRQEPEPGLAGDDLYAFRHLLIRDAAYDGLPKAERARLHEAVADWLERVTADRIGEYEEVLAHHLDRAYRYRLELGAQASSVEDLGRRAARHFAASAHLAIARGDVPATIALRRQALSLPLPDTDRIDLLVQQARNHLDSGDLDATEAMLTEARSLVASVDDPVLSMRLQVGQGFLDLEVGEHPDLDRIADTARGAAALLETAADAVGLARAMDLLARAAYYAWDTDVAGPAWRRAAEWALRSGDPAEAARILPLLPGTATYGWATTSEAIRYCGELAAAHPDSPMLQARVCCIMALAHAERGEFDRAVELTEASRAASGELGLPTVTAETFLTFAEIAVLRKDWAAAERNAVFARDLMIETGYRMEWTATLSLLEAVYRQGRDDEVRQLLDDLERGQVPGAPTSSEPRTRASDVWRGLVAAKAGDARAAHAALNRQTAGPMDPHEEVYLLEFQAEALEVLGEPAAALEALLAAEKIHERKEHHLRLAAVRESIARLRDRSH